MEILTEKPFKILYQGDTDTIVEYKNIENDLPLYEQKQIDEKPEVFKIEQIDFNSAELYNKELREKHQNISSFDINSLSDLYQTKRFKTYKINQIITVTEYLQKVLKMIFSIERAITKIEKKTESIISEKKFNSLAEMNAYSSTLIITNLFDLLQDIKISITELETDNCSININSFVSEIWETLRLTLAVYYVPDEIASKIDSLYSHISLKKISSLADEEHNKKAVAHHLKNLENKLYFVINLFITNLANQFSYYVTSPSFLNNPLGKCIFVIPMSMYLMFDFYKSGLTTSEIIKKDSSTLFSINQKQIKFYKTVDEHLKNLQAEAKIVQTKVKVEDEFFNIQMLIDYYKKMNPFDYISKVEDFISDPVVFEKMSVFVQKIRQQMIVCMDKNENPWQKTARVYESKDIDNSTIYFLLKLYESRPVSLPKFPQSQLTDLLNLCYYANTFEKCVNDHVRKYKRGQYRVSASYENLFLPILKN